MSKTYAQVGAALALAVCAVHAGVAAPKRPAPAVRHAKPLPPVRVALALDKTTVQISAAQNSVPKLHATLTLANHSAAPLTFGESGQKYEWQVLNSQGQIVWDYAIGRMFPHFIIRRTLPPGRTLTYPCDIPLQMQKGAPLPPGRYTLQGRLFSQPQTVSQSFVVTQ